MTKNPKLESLVLGAIGSQPGITRLELNDVTGLTKEAVRNEVRRLAAIGKIHTNEGGRGGRFAHPWYLKGDLSIIQQVEKAVLDADKALTGSEIAARLNLESQKVYQPLNKLLKGKNIYLAPTIGDTCDAVMAYLHTDNRPSMSSMQAKAHSLGMSAEVYAEFSEGGLTTILCDAELRGYCQTFYPGSNAVPQFLGS